MKKGMLYLIPIVLIIAVLIWFTALTVIKRDNSYVIKNDQGEPINASIYPRWKAIDGKKIQELVLYFDRIETAEKVLILIPTEQLIGLPEGGPDSFYQILGNYLYQKESGRKFTPINNSTQELIKDYSFSNTEITFNTFDELKQYGNSIVIEKR